MIWLWLLLGQATNAGASPSPLPKPPSLIVQVVDPAWIPAPGIEIIVRARHDRGAVQRKRASMNGTAEFWLESQAEYSIETTQESGFRSASIKSCRTFVPSQSHPTAYVQIRLQISGKPVVIH